MKPVALLDSRASSICSATCMPFTTCTSRFFFANSTTMKVPFLHTLFLHYTNVPVLLQIVIFVHAENDPKISKERKFLRMKNSVYFSDYGNIFLSMENICDLCSILQVVNVDILSLMRQISMELDKNLSNLLNFAEDFTTCGVFVFCKHPPLRNWLLHPHFSVPLANLHS